MQQAEGLFKFDLVYRYIYENLIVSLINVCHPVPLIMLCTEAIYMRSLFISIKALQSVCSCICIVLEKFWSQENSFTRNIRNFAKFASQQSENRKILGSDPG